MKNKVIFAILACFVFVGLFTICHALDSQVTPIIYATPDSSSTTEIGISFGLTPVGDGIMVGGVDTDGYMGVKQGGSDAFIAKIGPNGQRLWSTTFGSSAFDEIGIFGVNTDGNLIACVYTDGDLWGAQPNCRTPFIACVSPTGTVIWHQMLDPNQYQGVAVVSLQGDILVKMMKIDGTSGVIKCYTSTGSLKWSCNIPNVDDNLNNLSYVDVHGSHYRFLNKTYGHIYQDQTAPAVGYEYKGELYTFCIDRQTGDLVSEGHQFGCDKDRTDDPIAHLQGVPYVLTVSGDATYEWINLDSGQIVTSFTSNKGEYFVLAAKENLDSVSMVIKSEENTINEEYVDGSVDLYRFTTNGYSHVATLWNETKFSAFHGCMYRSDGSILLWLSDGGQNKLCCYTSDGVLVSRDNIIICPIDDITLTEYNNQLLFAGTGQEGKQQLISGYLTVVAAPTFSLAPGTYTGTQSVSISCATTGATIRYTTDGSEPTEASTQYTVPISVNTNTTVKARAFKSATIPSLRSDAVYTIRKTISGTLTLGNYTGSINGLTASILLRRTDGTPLQTSSAILNSTGAYSFLTEYEGSMEMLVTVPRWLKKKSSLSVTGNTTCNLSLTNGDADGGNSVNLFDYVVLDNAYGTVPGDPSWNFMADLDGGLSVNSFDYTIIDMHFGAAGDN